ncbi:MAG: hypothetical protein IJW03_05200 [Clostridia bacterium]|nr:hypothetical protein [Clostridia bacterium]
MPNTEKATPELREALARIDKYYDRVMLWLAHMYDERTGGFHMAMSGKLDPDMEPAVEMTSWGLSFINDYAKLMPSIPAELKEKFIQFFYDRQDSETGLFVDKQGPVNAREQARNQMSGLGACKKLGITPKYSHPGLSKDEKAAADAPLMPDFMASPESYIAWMETLPWDEGSWHAGDKVESSQQFMRMLPEDEQKRYTSAMFAWLDAHQFESGMWSERLNFTSISGIYKVGRVYAFWGKKLPRYEAAIDTIFECYHVDKLANPYYVRNPLSVLLDLCSYGEDVKAKIQQGILDNIDPIVESFAEFLCPDGAFCAALSGEKKSMTVFGGVRGSHGLHEGDIDATFMMLIARGAFYRIFDLTAPPLAAPDFWDWLAGTKPLPEL